MEDNIIYKCLFILCSFGSVICNEGGTHIKHIFYYDGSGDGNISCNGNDVITVTDIQLINHPTNCTRGSCTLTYRDRNHIETCNGNSTCVIPIDNLSPCLKDKGFYNVEYSCQRNAFYCDFQNDACGWSVGESGWSVASSDDDPYLYVYTNRNIKTRSKIITGNKKQCLSFFYYIQSSASIKLYIRNLDNNIIEQTRIWPDFNSYYWDLFEISIMDAADYTIELETTSNGWSLFKIDDINIVNTFCNESIDLKQIPHNQKCNYVDETTSLDGCYSEYLSLSTVRFDPTKDNCKDYLPSTSVCWSNEHVTYCDAKVFVSKHPSCLNLNTLRLEYTCTGTLHGHSGSRITNESDETGMVVGLTIGGLLIIGLICTVALLIYRRRYAKEKGKAEKGNNDLSASWHVNGQGAYMNSVQLSTQKLPTGSALANNLATNNPSYEQGYIIASANKSVSKGESEYMNLPKPTALTGGHNTTSEYNVLDPKETGFNRTNGNIHELASPTNANLEDEYAESGAGVYDISGNSRHKVNDTIYDHSVDDTYDTSNRGRQDDLGDHTYNHVFGRQTGDDYDIAGS